jgi:succinoglycan biosynthesis transport protein ExoP
VVALALGLGTFYVLTGPRYYTATATLLIDTRKNQLFQQQSVLSDIAVDTASVESQVQILRSETIALAVIKEFHLAQSGEFNRSGGILGSVTGGLIGLVQPSAPKSEFEQLRSTMEAFLSRLSVRRVGLTYVLEISFTSLSPDQSASIANAVANAYVTDLLDAKYKATKRAVASQFDCGKPT